jgi:hypothetical protein
MRSKIALPEAIKENEQRKLLKPCDLSARSLGSAMTVTKIHAHAYVSLILFYYLGTRKSEIRGSGSWAVARKSKALEILKRIFTQRSPAE